MTRRREGERRRAVAASGTSRRSVDVFLWKAERKQPVPGKPPTVGSGSPLILPLATIARTRKARQKKTPQLVAPPTTTTESTPSASISPQKSAMKYAQSHQTISSFLERCEKEKIDLPENPYEAMQEVSMALKQTQGKEEEAFDMLKERFSGGGSNNKRSHADSQNGGNDKDDETHEDMPPHKRTRLLEEARSKPAAVKENQKLVDAFADYAQKHLDQGHTGKFVSHVRAANYIRDYEKPIKSGRDAEHVGYIGRKMADQIEEVIKTGKFKDETPDMNVTRDYDHFPPPLVAAIRESPAKRKENQKIVDVLTEYAENQLKYGNSGKGTSHLRAAKQIHDTDVLVDSGFRAQSKIGYIGSHLADKIDQILTHGKIVHDDETSGAHRIAGERAPIVQDLIDNPAKVHENQKIVDALRDYGDAHLRGGSRGKGISTLRSAVQIRNADFEVKSGGEARKIGYVGMQAAKKVDQILRHGHADSDDDYVEGEEEEEEEEEEVEDNHEHYGKPHQGSHQTPLVKDVRSQQAKCPENQPIIDALADYGEGKLNEGDSGRGVTYLRAARELVNSGEVITSSTQAKKVGMIGNKVAQFIEETLKKNKK